MGKVKHRGSHSGIEAKKHLGQHFLNDENVAISTAELIEGEDLDQVIEIGPGTGVLTEHLYKYLRKISTLSLGIYTSKRVCTSGQSWEPINEHEVSMMPSCITSNPFNPRRN